MRVAPALVLVALASACPVPPGPDVVLVLPQGTDCTVDDTCAFDFGVVPSGAVTNATFAVDNRGAVDASIDTVALVGDGALTLVARPAATLGAGQSADLTLGANPAAATTVGAQLVLRWTYRDVVNAQLAVQLSATGR